MPIIPNGSRLNINKQQTKKNNGNAKKYIERVQKDWTGFEWI